MNSIGNSKIRASIDVLAFIFREWGTGRVHALCGKDKKYWESIPEQDNFWVSVGWRTPMDYPISLGEVIVPFHDSF